MNWSAFMLSRFLEIFLYICNTVLWEECILCENVPMSFMTKQTALHHFQTKHVWFLCLFWEFYTNTLNLLFYIRISPNIDCKFYCSFFPLAFRRTKKTSQVCCQINIFFFLWILLLHFLDSLNLVCCWCLGWKSNQ